MNADALFAVTFQPLDETNILDANYSVASIFSIWTTDKLEGCAGKDIIGAALSIYGPRTTIITHNAVNNTVEE